VRKLLSDRVNDTKIFVLRQHRQDLIELPPLAKLELAEFVDDIAETQPTISPETLSAAVKAAIKLEQSRSGASLLRKLTALDEDDLAGLNRLLEDWTIRDALTVLDEIDRRISVIEALEKLSLDPSADELKTLHPLVTQAKWLFGPEYDSPLYASNTTLRRAVEKVFGQKADPAAFINPRKRPDLVVLGDATLSAVAFEEIDEKTSLSTMQKILIVELKRGSVPIGREQITQASNYIEDLLNCGLLDGNPYIRAFVVGESIAPRTETTRRIGDLPEKARIDASTYSQLVRTASARLFRLREELASRYEDVSESELMRRALSGGAQLELRQVQLSKAAYSTNSISTSGE
jgi:hypothetical protein